MLAKVTLWNQLPFKAIFNSAAQDSKKIQLMAWKMTDKMVNTSDARKISKLTTSQKCFEEVRQAGEYNALSDQIFETSQIYHAASFALTYKGGPQTCPSNQHNNPLNFFHSSLRNLGVVALVTADAAKPSDLERGPQLLQILPGPPMVEYPDDNNDNDTGMDD